MSLLREKSLEIDYSEFMDVFDEDGIIFQVETAKEAVETMSNEATRSSIEEEEEKPLVLLQHEQQDEETSPKKSPKKKSHTKSSKVSASPTHLSQSRLSSSVHRVPQARHRQQSHHPEVLSPDQIEALKHKLLAASYTTYGPDVKSLFRRIDQDGSGQIEKKELAAIVKKLLPDISSNQITHLMKTCDEDKSGKISYTEFIRFLGQRSSQTSHYAYAQDL